MNSSIVIADDHPLYRTALVQTIQSFGTNSDSVECIACSSLNEVHDCLKQQEVNPDLVLLDLHMPGINGFSGLIDLRATFPQTPIAIISGDDNQKAINRAQQLGAVGFISKSLEAEQLQRVINKLLDGDSIFDKTTNTEDIEWQECARQLATLTPHQFRVFNMLSQGLLNKQIAYDLEITEPTVKSHVTAILRKLGLRKRTEVILLSQKFESLSEA